MPFCILVQAQFSVPRLLQEHEHNTNTFGCTADIDMDGDLDAFLSSSRGIAWFENSGSGLSWTRHDVAVGYPLGSTASLGDIDGDQDPDLLFRVPGTGMLLHENLGNGSFIEHSPSTQALVGLIPVRMQDLNGDGTEDAIGYEFFGQDPALFRYQYLGAGQWQAHGPLHSGEPDFNTIKQMDINGDGLLDLVLVGTDSVRCGWMEGDGSGGFAPVEPLLHYPLLVGDVVPVDLDGDGDQDLMASYRDSLFNSQLGWLEQVGGSFLPVADLLSSPGYALPSQLGVADLDQNGTADLVYTDQYATGWIPDVSALSDSVQVICGSFLMAYTQEIVDMDNDGDTDLVLSGVNWLENIGNGQFGEVHAIAQGIGADVVHLIDVQNDGVNDLLLSGSRESRLACFYADPESGFGPYTLIDNDANAPRWIYPVDDDGDGDQDILAHQVILGRIVRYEATGPGVYSTPVLVKDSIPNGMDITADDLDSDGDVDLVIGGHWMHGLFWLEGLGAGAYGQLNQLDTNNYYTETAIGDVNGDSIVDVIANVGPLNSIQLYEGLGGSAFGPAQLVTSLAQYSNFCLLFDPDSDGDLDLLATDQNRRLACYTNNGSGVFSGPITIDLLGADALAARIGDIDKDGDTDIIATFEDWTMGWFANDGSGAFGTRIPVNTASGDVLLGLFDLDADSDLDILYGNAYFGNLMWFESFIDGGLTASGNIYADMDLDAIQDPGEPWLMGVRVQSDPLEAMCFSAANGAYNMYLPSGTYTIIASPEIPEFWGQTTDPVDLTFTLDSVNPYEDGLHIGFAPSSDTTVIIAHGEVMPAACGGVASHFLTVTNWGTTRPNVLIEYILDTLFQYEASYPPADSVAGNSIFWRLDSLPWLQPVSIVCEALNPSSAVVQLDSLTTSQFMVHELDSLGDILGSTTTEVNEGISCAYDPNDKRVDPAGYGEHGAVPVSTERLHYSIRFQNTGTAQAFDVMLRDRLHAGLDRSSLRIEGFSHVPSGIELEADGELVVRFEGINLPDSGSNWLGSQGYFAFSIEPDSGSGHLSSFTNQAEIYFDFEEAVATNTVTTTLVDCDLWEPVITVHPFGYLEASAGDQYQWLLDGIALVGDTLRTIVPEWDGDYTALVTNEYGCSALSDPYQVILTGLVAPPRTGMRAAPSPFQTGTTVYFSRVLEATDEVMLTDVSGRILRRWNVPGGRTLFIERADLACGLYLLTLLADGASEGSTKLVVE